MRLKIIVPSALALLVLVFGLLVVETAVAWKCEVHPEQPTCTTLPPESTTSVPPTTTSVPDTTTTTNTTVPVELAPPVSVVRPPAPPRLAG